MREERGRSGPWRWILSAVTTTSALAVLIAGTLGPRHLGAGHPEEVSAAGLDGPAEPPAGTEVVLTEGTNIAAAVSPDGATVAFDLQGRIWTVPASGGEARALTDRLGDARQPAWSPDGGRIAFQAYWSGNWHVWSIRADGTDLTQHTFGAHDDREPHFSPDGERVVFSSDRGGTYDVWALEAATGELERLTEHGANEYQPTFGPRGRRIAYATDREDGAGVRVRGPGGSDRAVATVGGEAYAPSWSPSGDRLSFTEIDGGRARLLVAETGSGADDAPATLSAEDEDVFPFRASWLSRERLLYTGDGHLRERDAGGGSLEDVPFRAVVTLDRPDYGRKVRDFDGTHPRSVRGIVSPSVAPDGDAVAFSALGDLWIQEVEGEARRLTESVWVESDPTFSPDGRLLAYTSDRGGDVDLWVRDLETGRDRRVTETPESESAPAWSPDGRRLAFLAGGSVRAVDADGGASRAVKAGLFIPGQPTWSSDGRTLAVGVLEPYSSRFREGVNEILILDAEADSTQEGRTLDVFPHRSKGTRTGNGPVWSPDGRSLAVVVSGLLYRIPLTPEGRITGPPERLLDGPADQPSWTGDSGSVVYLDAGRLKRVRVSDGAIREIGLDLSWRRGVPTDRYVIHAGRLWDGASRQLREGVDVWIRGHRIARVEPHADHRGARVVDASDGVVMPGLIEMHNHQSRTTEKLGRLWLSYGITTVRDPSADPHVAVARRELWTSEALLAPRLFTVGYNIDGGRIYYGGGPAVTSPARLHDLLDWAEALEYDFQKTYVRLPDARQKRVVERAHEIGIPVTSHEVYPAVAYGADGVEHVRGTSRRGYSPKVSELYRTYQDIVALLAESGMWLTPTVGIYGAYSVLMARHPEVLDDPRLETLFPDGTVEGQRRRARAVDDLDERERMVSDMAGTARRVVEAGGRVIAGTDGGPDGLTLHLELQSFVEHGGMTPWQALRSATAVAAGVLGAGEDLGTVEAGKLADLVILGSSPLDDIGATRDVRTVVENGRVHTLEELLRSPGEGP